MFKGKFLVVFVIALGLNNSYKIHAAGKDAFSFLLVTPSPRAASIGESYVAIAEGPETVFYNPSGLAFQVQSQLYIPTIVPPLLEDMKYSNFVYVKPIPDGAWSFQSGMMHMGGFSRTVVDATYSDGYREEGNFSTYDFQVGMSLGRKIAPNFAIGSTVRYIRESLSDAAVNSSTFDFGFIYFDEIYPCKLGLSIQNIGPKVNLKDESFSLPYLLRVGLTFMQRQNSSVPLIPKGSLCSVELFKPLRGENSLRAGIEIPFAKRLTLRSGYRYSFKKDQGLGSELKMPNGFTFGLGVSFKACQLDFATISQGELGLSHRVALNLMWNAK